MSRSEASQEVDEKYRKVLASLESGLLIMVNASTKYEAEYDEMEVDYAKDTGEVYLNGHRGQRFRIYFHRDLGPRIEELDDEGYGGHENAVETIEVIGHA